MRGCRIPRAVLLLIVKMATTYKFTYFDIRGRGEVTRFVFAQAGVAYTDDRVKPADWPALKPHTQYGYMPVLEINGGETISGSTVIPRYLAELPEFNLAGSNPIENAQIAAVANFLTDLETAIVKVVSAKEDAKEEAKKDFIEVKVPQFYGKLESFCSNGGYLFKDKLTWADFYFYELYEWVSPAILPNPFDNYPSLKKLTTTIEALPNIAKWIKERPKSDY